MTPRASTESPQTAVSLSPLFSFVLAREDHRPLDAAASENHSTQNSNDVFRCASWRYRGTKQAGRFCPKLQPRESRCCRWAEPTRGSSHVPGTRATLAGARQKRLLFKNENRSRSVVDSGLEGSVAFGVRLWFLFSGVDGRTSNLRVKSQWISNLPQNAVSVYIPICPALLLLY